MITPSHTNRISSRRVLLSLIVLALSLLPLSVARAEGKPTVDPTYANDTTVYMSGPHLNTNPSPGLLKSAPPLYVLVYPMDAVGLCTSQSLAAGTCGSVTLPSGYQPQCDPCFHPGFPLSFAYHDHVVSGAPGFGTNGTAGDFAGPWHIYFMVYNPAFVMSPSFQPIEDDEAIPGAIAAGEFLPAFGGQYMLDTGFVLICPLVSSHA